MLEIWAPGIGHWAAGGSVTGWFVSGWILIHHVWVLVFQVTQVLLGQRPVLRVIVRVKNSLPELVGVEQPGLEGSMGLDVGVGGVGCYVRVSGVRTEGFP